MAIQEEIKQLREKFSETKDVCAQVPVLIELIQKCISARSIDIQPYLERLKELVVIINSAEYKAWALIYEATIKRRNGDREAFLQLAEEALQLFHSCSCKDGIAYVYNNMGLLCENQGNYSEALENYSSVLRIRQEIAQAGGEMGDKSGVAATYTNIGNVFWRQGNYPEALKNYLHALKLWEEIEMPGGQVGDKQGVAISYSNIGVVYADQGNYPEALKNHLASLEIKQEMRDEYGLAMSYFNIGNVYYSQSNYVEALKNFSSSLKIRHKIDNKPGIADSYSNIGSAYYAQGNYSGSMESQLAALRIRKEIGDKQGTAISCNCIGNILEKQGRYVEALQMHQEAANLARELGARKILKEAYEALSATCKSTGNHKAALDYYMQFHEVDKEIFGAESQQQLNNLRFQYNLSAKEKKLEIEHLRNVELKEAFEQLKLEKERSEQLLSSQLSELKTAALQAQMNPHFVFNSLNAIQRYIWKSNPAQATEYLASFAKLIRLVLENTRKPLVSLERDLHALEYYIQLEALRFENKFSWLIICSPEVDREEITIPPMLLQPFVENAIIHGLHPSKNAGRLTIEIKKKNKDTLQVLIEDNGVGRVRSAELQRADKTGAHQSLGLEVTQQRLEKIKGVKGGKVKITDLYDERDSPRGTVVEVELPV